MKTTIDNRNILNASSRENFKNNPVQYFTNWYVRGPFQHLPSEMYGKIMAMFYSLLKHTESKPITTVKEFQTELAKLDGPWNKEKEAIRLSLLNTDNTLTELKHKHFMHWMLNPFISGEKHSQLNHNLKEELELELNHYGDGKMNKTNDQAIEDSRSIEHKRAMDKIVQDQKEKNKEKQ
jgi:hypothetical protein